MKLSIDTVAKTVIIEHAAIIELKSIKGAIESVGGNPDEYSVVQLQPNVFYPTIYPIYPVYPSSDPYYGWKTGEFEIIGSCNIDSPIN